MSSGLAAVSALMNGGTFSIDSPRPYSAVADGLLKTLGIDPVALSNKCADRAFYPSLGLGRGLFFDKETFGADKLLVVADGFSWAQLLALSPLSSQAQSDIVRIEEAKIDYLPRLSSDEKKSRLSKMSYRDFLLHVVKADPGLSRSTRRGRMGNGASVSMPFRHSTSGHSAFPAFKA